MNLWGNHVNNQFCLLFSYWPCLLLFILCDAEGNQSLTDFLFVTVALHCYLGHYLDSSTLFLVCTLFMAAKQYSRLAHIATGRYFPLCITRPVCRLLQPNADSHRHISTVQDQPANHGLCNLLPRDGLLYQEIWS